MKKLICLLFMVISFFTYSQEIIGSLYLRSHLDEYIAGAKEFDIDLSNIDDLNGVYITSVETIESYYGRPAVGLTMENNGKYIVMIDGSIPVYLPTLLNAIIYHEMYHVLAVNKDHCQTVFCPYVLRDGQYLNIEYIIKYWDLNAKKEYFKYLKDDQEKLDK